MITVHANALSLAPKSNPEDMEKVKTLYACLDERLKGLESKMKELGCEKLLITVDTLTPTQRNEAMPRKLSHAETTLDELYCNLCDTKMEWADQEDSWICPTCGNTAWQDETCAPDELFFEKSEGEDDPSLEVMTMQRICSRCGCSFTLGDAMSEYNSHFRSDLIYLANYCGDICGSCAIEDTESQSENNDIQI